MVVNKSRPLDSSFFKLQTLLRLLDESKVGGRVGAKSVLVIVETLFVLVFELCLDTFFNPILLRADTE